MPLETQEEICMAHRLDVAVFLAGLFFCGPVQAQESPRFDVGLRFDALVADGEPANDMLGAGVFGRYRLNDRWRLGLAVDQSPEFDVERPHEFLGLASDPAAGEVDAKSTSTALTAWIERVYERPGRRLEWFWGAGGGFAAVDVEDVAGPLAGGGTYDITQEVGTEILASASAGLRFRFAERWALEAALRLDQHFTDWTVTDRVSGRTAALDDYLVQGAHFGLSYSF
jgi:hypothetical protein